MYLVNCAIEATLGDEPREFRVNEMYRDTEGRRHALQRERTIGLEELSVCENAHLPGVVPRVRAEHAGGDK